MILLGTLHKCWKTSLMELGGRIGDGQGYFLGVYIVRFLRVAVLLSLWRTILAGREEASGMSVVAILTYTLISEVFRDPLDSRTDLETALWEGSVATRYVRPMGVFLQFAAQAAGGWLLNFCLFSVPLLLLSPLLGVRALPADWAAAGGFAISLSLAVSVGLALDFIFSATMVRLEHSIYAVQQIRRAVSILLSGALLPLALLPWGLGAVLDWLPFASMASAPLRIYTGTGNVLSLAALQAAWSAVLWPIAFWVWRVSREKLVSHGG